MVRTASPKVSVYPNERGVARALAERLSSIIAANPRLVLGLPTGRTPVLLYRELALLHQEGRIDFSRVTTFNLDEFLGVPPSDPGSYRTFMQRHLFSRVNISTERVHFLNGASAPTRRRSARATSARSSRQAGSTCRSSASAPTATSASTSPRASCSRTRTA